MRVKRYTRCPQKGHGIKNRTKGVRKSPPGVDVLPVVHRRLEDVNKLLVAGELGRDDGEDVPVVLLHDVQHQQRLLLDGGTELEERRLYILVEQESGGEEVGGEEGGS